MCLIKATYGDINNPNNLNNLNNVNINNEKDECGVKVIRHIDPKEEALQLKK